ncbi:MAG: hypothetical protein ABIC68_08540 [Candidatus Omnitrophota bacterium]
MRRTEDDGSCPSPGTIYVDGSLCNSDEPFFIGVIECSWGVENKGVKKIGDRREC